MAKFKVGDRVRIDTLEEAASREVDHDLSLLIIAPLESAAGREGVVSGVCDDYSTLLPDYDIKLEDGSLAILDENYITLLEPEA